MFADVAPIEVHDRAILPSLIETTLIVSLIASVIMLARIDQAWTRDGLAAGLIAAAAFVFSSRADSVVGHAMRLCINRRTQF